MPNKFVHLFHEQQHFCWIMLTIALVVFILLLVYLVHKWYRIPANSPPGPRGLPILGVLPFLSKFPERDFGAWGKKYGPLISVPMGLKNWIVLNDYDIIVEALIKRSDEFYERPYMRYINQLSSKGVVFATGGGNWLSHRKFGTSALRKFGGSKGVMEKKVLQEVRYFIEQLELVEGKSFQMQEIINMAVANVICSIAFGNRFHYDDEKFQNLVSWLLKVFKSLSHWMTNLILVFPFLCDVPPFSWHIQRSEAQLQHVTGTILEFLEEHKSTYDPKDIRDVMSAYLQTFQHRENNFATKNCQDFFVDLFTSGSETTSSTLCWGFLCLMHHPDVQERMHEEIKRVIGKDDSPSLSHREQMPYACAVLHEILRFKTLAPLSLPRCTAKDVTIRGYRIAKGTQVMANLWNVHNNDTYWEDPHKFDPQRHLDGDGSFTNSRHVMPFGAGARVCLGEQIARTELWIFLVSVIQKFRVSFVPDSSKQPGLDQGANGLVYVPNPFSVILKSR